MICIELALVGIMGIVHNYQYRCVNHCIISYFLGILCQSLDDV